jgi:seryl-tRNA synthetase
MVDFKDILNRPEIYKAACANKRVEVDINRLVELGSQKSSLEKQIESLRAEINANADEIKVSAQNGQKPEQAKIEKGRELKEKLKALEAEIAPIEVEFTTLIYTVPNLPSDDTPVGPDEDSNVVLRQWGTPRDFAAEGFEPKEHWQLGEELDVIDLDRATKVSGARFAYLKGGLVMLQLALIQLAFEKLTDENFIKEVIAEFKLDLTPKPFTPVIPPVIINPEPFTRMARIEPREERYHITHDDQFLVGSAEHTLGAMHMDETFKEAEMPVRYIGYSTAFRREAGSYGKDMKGILRVHQFDKVEAEVFSTAETSQTEQDLLVAIQEKLMQLLNLPYEVMITSTGDQGTPDARHLDINTWLPGQNKYRETHSADLMTDYQARRLNTRVERKEGGRELVHMNDATVFAIGRTLIAIMENYQQKDGSIIVPDVLRKYCGLERIAKL